MENKKLIIFDLWQTLVDAKMLPSSLVNSLPLPRPDPLVFTESLSQSDLFLKDIGTEDGIAQLLVLLGYKNDVHTIRVFSRMWEDMLRSSYLIPGAEEVLQQLKRSGYKFCLMTNIDKFAFENFPFPSLINRFDHLFLSYKEGVAKPELACWKIVSERTSCAYGDMIMIGNSMKDDITPATALGIDHIHIGQQGDFKEVYDKLMIPPCIN